MLTSGLYKSNTEHDCRACRETFSKAISDLTFQNKVLRDQVEAYKNGSKIRQLREMYEQQIRKLELKNRKLQCDNEDKDRRLKVMNDRWMEVNDDVCKERDAAVQKAQKQADAATERANQAEEKRQDLKNEYSSYRKEMEEKLKQEQKENDKLSNDLGALQVEKNRNFKNSSKPSSTDPNHVKVYNTRKKSGLKPGGQPGHIFHGRQMQKPTDIQWIDPPDKFLDPLQYRMTGRVIRKQEVGIEIIVTCTEYRTPEFRKLDTGQRVHAGFPHGLKDDVTYDGSIKALAYLLNQEMNVSIGNNLEAKVRDLRDTTGTGSKKVKILDQLTLSGSYNFLADSLKMSNIGVSASTNLFNKLNLSGNLNFDPYAVNERGQRINKYNLAVKGVPLRLTNASLSASISFNGKGTIDGNDGRRSGSGSGSGSGGSGSSGGGEGTSYQRIYYHPITGEYIPGGFVYYMNPNSPWSVNLSYSFSYAKTYQYSNNQLLENKRFTQTINASGNLKLTPRMSINASSGFDIMAMKITTTQISATYDLHCFNIAVSWVPTGQWKSYSFRIAANASALADLLRFKKSSSYMDNLLK